MLRVVNYAMSAVIGIIATGLNTVAISQERPCKPAPNLCVVNNIKSCVPDEAAANCSHPGDQFFRNHPNCKGASSGACSGMKINQPSIEACLGVDWSNDYTYSSPQVIIPPKQTGRACVVVPKDIKVTKAQCWMSDEGRPQGAPCTWLQDDRRTDSCFVQWAIARNWEEGTSSNGEQLFCVSWFNESHNRHRYLWLRVK